MSSRRKKMSKQGKFTIFAVIGIIFLSFLVAAFSTGNFDTRSRAQVYSITPTPPLKCLDSCTTTTDGCPSGYFRICEQNPQLTTAWSKCFEPCTNLGESIDWICQNGGGGCTKYCTQHNHCMEYNIWVILTPTPRISTPTPTPKCDSWVQDQEAMVYYCCTDIACQNKNDSPNWRCNKSTHECYRVEPTPTPSPVCPYINGCSRWGACCPNTLCFADFSGTEAYCHIPSPTPTRRPSPTSCPTLSSGSQCIPPRLFNNTCNGCAYCPIYRNGLPLFKYNITTRKWYCQ